MVSKQVVLDTIKRMYGSGVDDATVKATLKDLGLSNEDIDSYIAEAKGEAPKDLQTPLQRVAREIPPAQEEEPSAEEVTEGEMEQAAPPKEEMPEEHEKIVQRTTERIKEHIDDAMQAQELSNTSTQAELQEHKERLEGVHRRMEGLHTKMDLTPSMPMETVSQIKVIEKRLSAIEKELVEIKATTNGLSSLLKKMIETNREILNSLKK